MVVEVLVVDAAVVLVSVLHSPDSSPVLDIAKRIELKYLLRKNELIGEFKLRKN